MGQSIRADRGHVRRIIHGWTSPSSARRVRSPARAISSRVGSSTVALDFGMFQGRRSDANDKNLTLPFA